MRRGERRAKEDIIKLCSIKHGSQHLPNRSASHAAKGSSGGGGIVVLLSNRVKQINGCSHSGTKVKDPVRSTNTHMYAFSCNPNPNMHGASLLRIVRRQGRWRIVVRHPLVLQHAERPLNRWSAHSGTQKGGLEPRAKCATDGTWQGLVLETQTTQKGVQFPASPFRPPC